MLCRSFKNESYYKTILAIAVPISIQSLFQASLSVIDQLMVGQLGENAIAAVGLGSRFPFIFITTLSAIATTTSIFSSQFWGKKDIKNIGHTFGGTFALGMIITIIFSLISLVFPNQVVGLYSRDEKIIEMGGSYLRITAVSYLPLLLTSIFSAILRSTEHVRVPMYAGLLSIVLNTSLNFVLIFGQFGFPKLGLYGTAYATVIARFIEAIVILTVTYGKKYVGAFKVNEFVYIPAGFVRNILIVGCPLVLNEFMWSFGETMYSVVYGRMGTSEVASMTLTYPIQNLSIGLFTGLGSAAGIMVGNKLGVGDSQLAFKYSKKFVRLGIIGSILMGVILLASSNLYVLVFNISDSLKHCTVNLLIVFSIVLWIKVSNMIIGGGILRSGGKTHYTLFLDMFGTWCIGVPAGFISAFIFKLSIEWVYLIICGEEFVRFIIGLKLLYSKRWMKSLTNAAAK